MSTLASVILKGVYSAIPAASIPGRLYFATDTNVVYRDNGTTWDEVVAPAMTNPMTTAGDVIVGGAAGAPTRLAAGAAATVLTSNGAGVAPSYQAAGGGAAVDILSDQKASGTLFSAKAEYLAVTAGETITLLSESGAGYVSSILLAFENETNAQTGTIEIYVNGDAAPNLSMSLQQFFEAVYIAGSGSPNTCFANRFFGANTASASANAMFSVLPIPYSNGIVIQLVLPDADTIFYNVSGQSGVADNWPNTRKLWANASFFNAPAANSTETLLNFAGPNPGRYVGLWMLSDGYPNALSPYGADLEGNVRIYIDQATSVWAASTAFSAGQTVIDSNGNLQTVTTAGTSGTAQPAWGILTGATVTDGTVVWTCTVGDPPNIWRASAVYTVGMSVLDANGNVQTVTTAGTTGAAAPTWATSGTTTDGTVTWSYSLGSSRIQAAYQSSGTEDYFLQGFYGGGIPGCFTGNGFVGRTFVNINPETGSFYRFHVPDPIRFTKSIAVLRQTGDTSEVNFTGAPRVYATAYWYTEDTN
ncbi:MAG: DUF2961 domain-containing protein [Acidobacteriaceae bacterium]